MHAKLKDSRDLLNLDIDFLTEHFSASRFPYSTQALPVNVLLDTLVRPNGETDETENKTCVAWRYDSQRAVPHLVFGNAPRAGGQWVENPVKASWDIGTLSYANMLSLPGYSFSQHYWKVHGRYLPSYVRPSRKSVASYFAAYPSQVGIDDKICSGQRLEGITRTADGFHIASHGLKCKHLVLSTGIFSELIPPRPMLQPLLSLPDPFAEIHQEPLLVVGSGFSAADVIISTPPSQKIIHIFKWQPSNSPSPLRACHQQAYPEYAGVYRRMKLAALASERSKPQRPRVRRRSSTFDASRDWALNYAGYPNTAIVDVQVDGDTALVTLQRGYEPPEQRRISGFAYVIGRRGSLAYLDEELRGEVVGSLENTDMLSGQSLREKALEDLEIAPNVFITGSLTGDTLIRFAYGSCAYAAARFIESFSNPDLANGYCQSGMAKQVASPYISPMNGLDGHNGVPAMLEHSGEPLDRRKDDEVQLAGPQMTA